MELDVYKEWLGIPDGPRPPDHYTLLRAVRFEDNLDKIRSNYRKLNAHVRKYATGQYSLRSQELLNELAKAMLCLTDEERKKEYDQSIGREVEDDHGPMGRKPLEIVLRDQGHLTSDQVEELRSYANRLGLAIRDAAIQMKLVDQATATQALGQESGLSYIDLSEVSPDDSVLDRVPRQVVRHNTILPLFIDEGVLLFACTEPSSHEIENELQARFDLPVRAVLATPQAINQAISKYYPPGVRETAVEPARKSKKGQGGASKKSSDSQKPATDRPEKSTRMTLTPADQREQMMLGIIIICFGFVVPFWMDRLIIPRGWPYILTMTLTPLTAVISWMTYLKK